MSTQNQLDQLIGQIEDFPSLSGVVSQINTMLRDPRTSSEDVGKAILNDQALASKVLKLVNSAFYGFPGQIKTLSHAIALLGFSTIRNIVLTTSIIGALQDDDAPTSGLNLKAFWLHSITVGALAKTTANLSRCPNPDEYFLAGLLHDIGKLVLHLHLNEKYQGVFSYIQDKQCTIFEAENKVLGFTHTDVGAWLADKWALPLDIKEVLEFHHSPENSQSSKLVSTVHFADILARGLQKGNGGDPYIPELSIFAVEALELDQDKITKVLNESRIEIENASIFMSII